MFMKGDKGQYFTPRHVIKMCIEILDPQDGETLFDPACGSG
jgi:type I restriction enzyme M protein